MSINLTVLCAAGLAAWYGLAIALFFCGLKRIKKAGAPAGLSYSIVIAARNESKNIIRCLETVLHQTLGSDRFEVIVVDDRSQDSTADLVAQTAKQQPNLRLVSIAAVPPGIAPKKYAILGGMAVARNPVIVLTDADCRVPATWLETIDRHFMETTGLVQGITGYQDTGGVPRVLFAFQAVDFFSHTVVSAAAIGAGIPMNSNANNLAFRKQAFDDAGGYGSEAGVVSGDDDLLLQRVARSKRWKVSFMGDTSGGVETFPAASWKGMLEQRKRWGSVTVHYNPLQTFLLAGVFLFYCSIPVLLLAGICSGILALCGLVLWAIKIAGEYVLMVPATRRFGRGNLLPWIPVFSFPQLIMVLYAVLFGVFGKFNWKDQGFKRRTE
jgi:cellulose synthase/poly-beta-1,6-N-acetylglucosamine synthase-like glycosyltransferase